MNDSRSDHPNHAPPNRGGLRQEDVARTVAVCGATDMGKSRDHNEDGFSVVDLSCDLAIKADQPSRVALTPCGLLLAVYDGMGGHAAGEVAAALAGETIENELRSAGGAGQSPAEALRGAIARANRVILDESRRRTDEAGMGTTCTAAILFPDHAVFAEVGDSRAYLFRDGNLTQITRDQSLVATMLDAGLLTSEEARTFPHSNVILQALGVSEAVDPVTSEVRTRPGDLILLCSDGLHGPVPDQDIAAILQSTPSLAHGSRALIMAALDAGGPDNVTVILARYEGREALRA